MKKLILIDGNSVLFRAYHATAHGYMMQTSEGIYTNALFSFINMINKIISDNYDYIAVCFDTKDKLKRKEIYPEYKAGRKETPIELISQIPLVQEYLKSINIKILTSPGNEADDIIGSLSKIDNNILVDIYSSDRDLLQLINDNVRCILKSKDNIVYDRKKVLETYNIKVSQLIDYKALVGDKSDNIPGVYGIGDKKAIALLNEYENVFEIYDNIEKIDKSIARKLVNDKDNCFMSREIGTINTKLDLGIELSDLEKKEIDNNTLREFYLKYELYSLANKIKIENNLINTIEIKDLINLEKVLKNDKLSFYLELSDTNYHNADIWGLGIYDGKNKYFVDSSVFLKSIDFKNYMQDPTKHKLTYDFKKMYVKLRYHNIILSDFEYDLLISSYLIDPKLGKDNISDVFKYFDIFDIEDPDNIYGKLSKKEFKNTQIEKNYIAQIAKNIYITEKKAYKLLEENTQINLFKNIEMPLSKILGKMEYEGICVDINILNELKIKYENIINKLEERIYILADEKFNISSTKQLSSILFEKLNLPIIKKTKTGYSTNQSVLEVLVDKHLIIPEILKYRFYTKLYSTYIIGIESQIVNNKIHTIYQQALTQTGRLSSIEPNLQNIPSKTLESKEIKKMFVSDNCNSYLMSMDYSQIELRVLAHISKDEELIRLFNNHVDIHTQTASQVFKTNNVSDRERQMAKAVNFGIIYGISPWGLASDLKISPVDAKNYIQNYLNAFPGVNKYMQEIKEFAEENKYVLTIFNRRRYIPEIASSNNTVKQFGQRLALNSPIQGSAADILKIAMININNYFEKNNYKSRIILQVHDELIFNIVDSELEIMKSFLPQLMTQSAKLLVDLEVSMDYGRNWSEI